MVHFVLVLSEAVLVIDLRGNGLQIADYEHRFAEHEHDWLLRGLV